MPDGHVRRCRLQQRLRSSLQSPHSSGPGASSLAPSALSRLAWEVWVAFLLIIGGGQSSS